MLSNIKTTLQDIHDKIWNTQSLSWEVCKNKWKNVQGTSFLQYFFVASHRLSITFLDMVSVILLAPSVCEDNIFWAYKNRFLSHKRLEMCSVMTRPLRRELKCLCGIFHLGTPCWWRTSCALSSFTDMLCCLVIWSLVQIENFFHYLVRPSFRCFFKAEL